MAPRAVKEFSKSYIEANILTGHFEKNLDDYICNLKKENTDELDTKISNLIKTIFEVVNENEFTSQDCKTIYSVALCLVHVMEILNCEEIVSLCDMCLSSVRNMARDKRLEGESNNGSEQMWKTFIPKIIEVMEKKNSFEHCGSRTSGKEYKSFIIKTICAMKLTTHMLLPLTCMWIDVHLSDEEHEKVVKTLCLALKKVPIPPSELPPFIHQLLILTKNRNSNLVILKLRDYLVENVYSKLSKSATDSEDTIESAHLPELIEAESVIIYHIEECAKYSRSLVIDLIKLIKSIQSLPQNCLDPFILALLLSLSNISMYEAEILRIIKTIITNCFIEMEYRHHSGWIRKQEATACDVEDVFKTLIESNVAGKEKVLKGLVNISFTLLYTNASPKLNQSVVDKIRRTGRYMIILLIKKHRQVYLEVMTRLCQSLYSGDLNYQYTDTLHQICSMCFYSAQEHITPLLELIKSMFRLPHQIIRKIIVAVLPIAKLKSDFRNALILTLRKMLFSKDVYVKQTAVFGFLHILKQMQLKQLVSSCSQNSLNTMKGPSLFTQMIMDVHSSQSQQQNAVLATQMSANKNEAVCLEVLGVLRRCLFQPALVRSSLYKGFIECVHMNTELCLGSMELLLDHCRQYYVIDTDQLPPLQFDKIVTLSEKGDYELQEPVAELLLVLGQVVNTAKHNVTADIDNMLGTTIEIIGNKMDSLVDRFIKCNVGTFALNEESVDAAYRKEVTLQVLGVYEALMTYKLCSFSLDATLDTSNLLLNLFKQHQVFVDYINTLPKAKPGTKKSSEDGATQGTKKEEKASLNIKLPVTILDLKVLHKFFEILFVEEPSEPVQKVRSKRELRHYVLSTTLHVVTQMDSQSGDRKGSSLYKDVCDLAQILYKHVLLKWEETSESDSKMSVLCLNIFHTIISLIGNHYDAEFADFLFKVTGRAVQLGIKKQVLSLLKVYNEIISTHLEKLTAAPDEDEEYTEICNTLEVSFNTMAKITMKLENECIHLIRKWVVEIAETNEIKHKSICKQVIHLMLTLTLRDSDDVTILDTMTLQLGKLHGSSKLSHKLEIINKSTKQIILAIVCEYVTKCINSVEWFLVRLKSHYNILQLYTSEESATELSEKEKSLIQVSQLICTIVKNLASLKIPSDGTQCCLRVLVRCYTLLNNIARYYHKNSLTSYKDARFDCLVSFVSMKLSTQVADFVHNIEDDDKQAKHVKFVNQLVPRIILEQENFAKLILMLSKKNKDSSLKVRLIETRDYKLNVKKIQENVADNEQDQVEEDGIAESTSDVEEPASKRSRLEDTQDSVSNASSVY
uniref:Fanconi anemia group I protein homolog n=1 Tax=Cacopsylla melanoneura TaxID=428564 RepID=A0A8D8YHI6_9HEMI